LLKLPRKDTAPVWVGPRAAGAAAFRAAVSGVDTAALLDWRAALHRAQVTRRHAQHSCSRPLLATLALDHHSHSLIIIPSSFSPLPVCESAGAPSAPRRAWPQTARYAGRAIEGWGAAGEPARIEVDLIEKEAREAAAAGAAGVQAKPPKSAEADANANVLAGLPGGRQATATAVRAVSPARRAVRNRPPPLQTGE
jgi:hypothetical protein